MIGLGDRLLRFLDSSTLGCVIANLELVGFELLWGL